MNIVRDVGATVGVPGLGMIPSWQFSTDPSVNPKINPFVTFPDGVYQTTPQPFGPWMNAGGLSGLGALDYKVPVWWDLLSIASGAASAYHGYKRNDSVGWAIVWGLLGGVFPVITPAIAWAQGFGKKKTK